MITRFSAISRRGWALASSLVKGGTPASGCGRFMKPPGRGRRKRGLSCLRSMSSGSRACWNIVPRKNRRSFWRSSAPTRSAIRYPLPPAKLNSTRQRLLLLAIANAQATRGGIRKRRPGSRRRPGAGRCICSPASRAPVCTASTITAASAGRRKFRVASRCGCIRRMRRRGALSKAAW